MNFEHTFTFIPRINNEKTIGIGCGFQHTLFFTSTLTVKEITTVSTDAAKPQITRFNLWSTARKMN